jgi:hypothetical protein
MQLGMDDTEIFFSFFKIWYDLVSGRSMALLEIPDFHKIHKHFVPFLARENPLRFI